MGALDLLISPFGSPIGLIHQPRIFFADWCSNGVLEQIEPGCPSCNFGQLREIKIKKAAAKIYHGATYRGFGYVESISGIIFTIWGHVWELWARYRCNYRCNLTSSRPHKVNYFPPTTQNARGMRDFILFFNETTPTTINRAHSFNQIPAPPTVIDKTEYSVF